MYDDVYEAYLAHYGIKGMHWGVRKDRSSSETGSSKRSKPDKKSRLKSKLKAIKDSPYTQKAKNSALNALANQPGIIVGALAGAGIAATKGRLSKVALKKATAHKAALLNLYSDVPTRVMSETIARGKMVEEYHRLKKAGAGSKAISVVAGKRRGRFRL